MAEEHPSYVIIGAGQAGGGAAAALGAQGFAGDIHLVGAESWPPYERPPLSKTFLTETIDPQALLCRPANLGTASNIDTILGMAATAIDRTRRRVRLADGEDIRFDKLLIATGARPRRPAIPGHDLPGVHYLRTIDDALAIRASLGPGAALVVIGGGYIGLEVAASARQRGTEVVVVEAQETVLRRVLPPVLGRVMERLHRERGVRVVTGTGVAGFQGERRLSAVRLSDGQLLPADLAVVGIGAEPDTALAAGAGLQVEGGIIVDEFGRTSDPHIFAAGDVTRHWNPLLRRRLRLESWQNAQNQAIAVARSMCGGVEPYAEIPWFWSDQYDVNLQIVGLPGEGDDVVLRQALEGRRLSAFFLAADRLTAAVTMNQPRDIAPARRLIERKLPVDRRRLADGAFPLREFLAQPAGR